tara:strand:+ start:1739 stop:2071 length:333 start_codon:yes stop_codon:yes gene_type:complete
MSWKDNIRKAKFQGPKKQYSFVEGDIGSLKSAIRSIDFTIGKLAQYLEKKDIVMAKQMLTLVQERIDEIDAEVLEQEKYTGKTQFTPHEFGERIDSKAKYSGTKFQGPER